MNKQYEFFEVVVASDVDKESIDAIAKEINFDINKDRDRYTLAIECSRHKETDKFRYELVLQVMNINSPYLENYSIETSFNLRKLEARFDEIERVSQV